MKEELIYQKEKKKEKFLKEKEEREKNFTQKKFDSLNVKNKETFDFFYFCNGWDFNGK